MNKRLLIASTTLAPLAAQPVFTGVFAPDYKTYVSDVTRVSGKR